MSVIVSPNMNLPVPIVGIEPGPTWATDLNNCMSSIDSHDHSSGKGVPVTPAGLNINADLTFGNNNATAMRSVRFQTTASGPTPAIGASDLAAIYASGVDLYYVDGNGNQIRLTQGGSIVGTSGSISGLPSGTASASYVAGTFIWQSATNTAANMDAGSYILRNNTASSFGLTLQPPAAMGADYSITLPALPSVTNIMTLDASGNMGAALNVDNSSIQISSNTIAVKAQGITQADLALRATGSTVAAGGIAVSSSSGSFSSSSLSVVAVTNLSITITTLGRPVSLKMQPSGVSESYIGLINNAGNTAIFDVIVKRGSTTISTSTLSIVAAGATAVNSLLPTSSIAFDDVIAAGTYTYTISVQGLGAGIIAVNNAVLVGYEI